jgi:hypothetical protein
MSKVPSDARTTPATYAIPEKAHFNLVQIAFFVRLMAHLTENGTNASIPNARLAPDAMGWCFANLSKEMDAIVDAIHYSGDMQRSQTKSVRARVN